MSANDLRTITASPNYGTAIGTSVAMIAPIPGTAHGGGIYLVRAAYAAPIAVAAGSAPAIRLVTMTSAGAIIATIGANGSAALTAGTPIAGTISTPWISGTVGYLGVEWGHEAYGRTDNVLNVAVQYYHGRGSA